MLFTQKPLEPYIVTLEELPEFDNSVSSQSPIREISAIFNKYTDLPGIIVTNNATYAGMISRDRCFETLGRPFGVELYLKMSALEFIHFTSVQPLILEAATRIEKAVELAMKRIPREIYDPIVVRHSNGKHTLVDMPTLLTAQCELLTRLSLEFQQLSVKDPLTNICNRRGFFQFAKPQAELAAEFNTSLAALMVDIDWFKKVNDIYGHFVGDCVIRAVAEECQKCIRPADLIGRFGGEEFMILLSNLSAENTLTMAEKIRSSIENLVVFVDGYQVNVTVSIGASSFNGFKTSLDGLLNEADQALILAKSSGRNRVVQWDQDLAYKVQMEFANPNFVNYKTRRQNSTYEMEASRIYDETIAGWARALELRDKETEGHAQRVASMTIALAQKMGINNEALINIRRGALLHDIGKIAIPDHILFKPGGLTNDEWEIIRKHPVYAFELLSPISFFLQVIDIPYCHHEHWDGSGYPRGLKGEEIPLSARIFTIIDVWDALSTDRCYRPAWKLEKIRSYIVEETGKLFDPGVVNFFLDMIDTSLNKGEADSELSLHDHNLLLSNC